MTAIRATAPARTAVGVGTVAALGVAVLTARPALVADSGHPTAMLLGIFAVLGAVGLALPIPDAAPTPRLRSGPVVLAGIAVFAAGRVAGGGGTAIGPATLSALALNAVAAVAEEIWFRRVVFGWLAPAGRWPAIFGAAALFAAVHVTTYGLWVLPLDLVAGLVLGWQRDVTGSWRVPAITHVAANVLVAL